MSLEEALAANTAALIANTAAITGAVGATVAKPAKAAKVPAAADPAPTAAPAQTAAPATAPAAPAPASGPSVKELADALVALVTGKSREAGVAVLAQFGASKLPEVKPADYPAFLAAAKAALVQDAPGGGLL